MSEPFAAVLSSRERFILGLALRGDSIIDFPDPPFSSEEEVHRFLKVNEFDWKRPRDRDRLLSVHNEAIGYLRRELRFDLPQELLDGDRLVSFFLMASGEANPTLKKKACGLLKTMNIINHIDGRELLYNCPISLRDLFSLVEDKIERALSSLRHRQIPLRYQGGRKPKESLITKLLCKKETISAQIYDRVRYRIVTKTREDIVKVILYLFDTILPFNYVIPGASVNQLIPVEKRNQWDLLVRAVKNRLPLPPPPMEYTGRSYRVSKFVVDIPVRLDKFLATSAGPSYGESLGTITYVLVEFQIVDEETDQRNNSGECSHDNYKRRQKSGVIQRLEGGR